MGTTNKFNSNVNNTTTSRLRFKLRLLDSESRVVTITPWNQCTNTYNNRPNYLHLHFLLFLCNKVYFPTNIKPFDLEQNPFNGTNKTILTRTHARTLAPPSERDLQLFRG